MSLTPMMNVNPLDLTCYQQDENVPSYTISILPEAAREEVYEGNRNFFEFKSPLGDQSNMMTDSVTQLARKNYYKDEKMFLSCEWENCGYHSDCVVQFSSHVREHVTQADIRHLPEEDVFACLWEECGFESPSSEEMVRHINFHSFHTKIKCHGLNMIQKHSLAPCSLDPGQRNIVPDLSEPWSCQWEGCDQSETSWSRPREFYHHVSEHAEEVRGGRGKAGRLFCRWAGCEKTDGSVSKLKEHLRSHSQEKMIGCPNCGALFSNRVKFLDHVKRQQVTHEDAYKCNNCGKKFSLERLLRDHMRSHINHYKCPHCDMTCPTPSSLRSHMRYKHVTDKPYKCEFCDYTGKTQHDVKGHMKVHYEDVELKCGEEGCEYRCRAQATLKKHFLRSHSNLPVNNYACHLCDKRYNRGAYLTKHLIKSHNFTWPSGHSRFRYIRDEATGVHRLQTIRFESVDLQEELQGGDSLRIAESDPGGSARSVTPETGMMYRTSSPLPESVWAHKTSSYRSSNDGDAEQILSSLLSSHDEAYGVKFPIELQ